MLKVAKQLNQLAFSKLMAVYTQSNQDNGAQYYPGKTASMQLMEAEQDFYAYLQESFFRERDNCYALWEDCGRYLSAVRLERYKDGYLLAGLETNPDHRRKGYASRLICEVCDYLHRNGEKRLYAHIEKDNTASLRTHEKCGFVKILDHAVYIDGSVSTDAVTLLKMLK